MVLAFPCIVSGLLALPLCGAALTSLCRPQREVSKRKRLQPLILKRVPWLGGGSGASGICVLAHSASVTRASYFRRRCARRRVLHKTTRYVLTLLPRHRGPGVNAEAPSPRRSRRPPQSSIEAGGFPCIPVRDAHSAEWELTTPLSLALNVREDGQTTAEQAKNPHPNAISDNRTPPAEGKNPLR